MSLTIKRIHPASVKKRLKLPLFLARIPAGFPSPADDYLDKNLDLNEYLIKKPSATFCVRVEGKSMVKAGIHDGDILIVDRSLEPVDEKIVIAVLNGGFTVKRIRKINGRIYLEPENDEFKAIELSEEADCQVLGVITYAIHKV
jgi:DNA polymerase V